MATHNSSDWANMDSLLHTPSNGNPLSPPPSPPYIPSLPCRHHDHWHDNPPTTPPSTAHSPPTRHSTSPLRHDVAHDLFGVLGVLTCNIWILMRCIGELYLNLCADYYSINMPYRHTGVARCVANLAFWGAYTGFLLLATASIGAQRGFNVPSARVLHPASWALGVQSRLRGLWAWLPFPVARLLACIWFSVARTPGFAALGRFFAGGSDARMEWHTHTQAHTWVQTPSIFVKLSDVVWVNGRMGLVYLVVF